MQTLSTVETEERTVFSPGMLRCIGDYFLWYTWDECTWGRSTPETVVSILDWKSTQFENFCHTLYTVGHAHNGNKGCGSDCTHTYLPYLCNTCLPHAIHAYLMYEKNVKFEQSTVENEINWNRSIVERGFPCMTATEDHTGMVCSLCHKHCRWSNKSIIRKVVWNDVPCQSITWPALVKHSRSESDIDAMKMEAAIGSARTDWRIGMALKRVFRDKHNMLALLWV